MSRARRQGRRRAGAGRSRAEARPSSAAGATVSARPDARPGRGLPGVEYRQLDVTDADLLGLAAPSGACRPGDGAGRNAGMTMAARLPTSTGRPDAVVGEVNVDRDARIRAHPAMTTSPLVVVGSVPLTGPTGASREGRARPAKVVLPGARAARHPVTPCTTVLSAVTASVAGVPRRQHRHAAAASAPSTGPAARRLPRHPRGLLHHNAVAHRANLPPGCHQRAVHRRAERNPRVRVLPHRQLRLEPRRRRDAQHRRPDRRGRPRLPPDQGRRRAG